MVALRSLAPLAFASYAAAFISISGPNNPVAGAQTDIAWASSPTDPATFRLFLMDFDRLPFSLKQDFGEIRTADGRVTITFNANLPTDLNYVFRAVNASWVDQVFSTSGDFRLRPVGTIL
ncbi:hypothetical protein Moror_17684 [Moniliophthora roreri MCA 2997]|uniref:Yeast cell wall synthesis Kre9/Knh1-like N-terminal domain-containing protein n=2 Tax=Moniliophthora roreri TaxID=221103 RepID=V2XY95_MONRO|nr:hypothetical protein Moror_17684 [Moniliophthora roreri MCA 2997]KAI3596789.1 hypothetical protein WG66_016335 [Moniliophthora roreri]